MLSRDIYESITKRTQTFRDRAFAFEVIREASAQKEKKKKKRRRNETKYYKKRKKEKKRKILALFIVFLTFDDREYLG